MYGYWLMARLETNRLLASIDELQKHVEKAEAEYESIRRKQILLERRIMELGQ
jgi:cell division protein FtsB